MTYSLILRQDKGSKLSISEMDNNFRYLDKKSIDIPYLHISVLASQYSDFNNTTSSFDSGLHLKPNSDVQHLKDLSPEIWLFRKGRSGTTRGKRNKWIHCSDKDSNRPSSLWSQYSDDSKGFGSTGDLGGQENQRFGTLKTEWELPLDSFDNPVIFRIEAENYFAICTDNDKAALDPLEGDLSYNYLFSNNKKIIASYRGSMGRIGKIVYDIYSISEGQYAIRPIRVLSDSYEMAVAIVINDPNKPYTKIIGPMTKFNYKHVFSQSKSIFRIKIH